MTEIRPKDLLRLGREAEKAGQKRTAVQHYLSLSTYLRDRGDVKEALSLIQRSRRLSPESPRPLLYLAACEISLSKKEEARASIRECAHKAMERRRTDYYADNVESFLKDQPLLRQYFYEALLEVERTNANYFLRLADSLEQQSRWDQAHQAILSAFKTKGNDREVVKRLRELAERYGQVEVLESLQRFEDGKMSRKEILALVSGSAPKEIQTPSFRPDFAPPKPAPEREEKSLQALIRDLELKLGVEIQEKVDTVEPLVREFRERAEPVIAGDSQARLDMALAFFEMGLLADAKSEIAKVLETDEKYPEGQCLLGEILLEEGADLNALECYQRCLRMDSLSPEVEKEAHYRLGQIYLRLQDLTKTREMVVWLVQNAPEYRQVKDLEVQATKLLGEPVVQHHREVDLEWEMAHGPKK